MKNKMMRIASLVLVLTLLSTCAISGTFAKYVTSASGTDTARVAKFGVTVTANGNTFADAYSAAGENGNIGVAYATAGTTVKSGTAENDVVAPGTKGDMASMTLTGTPEVSVQVTYAATVTINDKWVDKDGNFYFPITVKVNGTAVDLSAATDAAGVKAAIEAAINEYSKTYAPGTNLADQGADSLTVSWEWPFSTSAANDVKDTYLGDRAAAGDAGIITIEVTTTVTQVD